jgi:integrase
MNPYALRGLHRLSVLQIKSITTPGWHCDGGGLYLEVDPSGAKRWAMRLTVNGKRRDFGLGPLHKVTLQSARARAAEYRAMAYAGTSPPSRVSRRYRARVGDMTFERAADEVHRSRKGQWSNGKHVDQWIHSLRDHVFPVLGTKPVAAVTTSDVLQALTPIWTSKPETARRLRQRIRTVLDWARAAGHRSGDNPVDLIGDALPRHTAKTEHHEALPYNEVGKFLNCLRAGDADIATKSAFEFLILTAARTTEVRNATWSEIDADKKLWTITPNRMKARRQHVVPLPNRAMELLKTVRPSGYQPTDLIFKDTKTGAALSENRFLNARDDIGYGGRCTPHGFRSSFRDWAAEETNYPPEVVEMALAHTIKNKVEAAYRRGVLLAKRSELMDAWAKYVGIANCS